MRSKVQRWGDSLAVRIPKALALSIGLEEDTAVELSVRRGALLISRVAPGTPTLDQLLAQVNDDNLHLEVETGPVFPRQENAI